MTTSPHGTYPLNLHPRRSTLTADKTLRSRPPTCHTELATLNVSPSCSSTVEELPFMAGGCAANRRCQHGGSGSYIDRIRPTYIWSPRPASRKLTEPDHKPRSGDASSRAISRCGLVQPSRRRDLVQQDHVHLARQRSRRRGINHSRCELGRGRTEVRAISSTRARVPSNLEA